MTADNAIGFLIVAVIIVTSIGSALRGLKRAADKLGQPGATKQQLRGAQPSTARPNAEQIQRIRTMEEQLARRGIKPPAALQSVIDAFEAAAAPPPPQTQQQPHPHKQHAPKPAAPAMRQPVPIARSTVVPVPLPEPVQSRSTRRMLAAAFADPAHARDAIVLAEILGPPVALR